MLAGLLYPSRCPMCGCLSAGICPVCVQKLKYAEEPLCFQCGKPLDADEEEYCADCKKYTHMYTKGRGLFLYQGAIKESVYKIKYQNKREYLEYYGMAIVQKLGAEIEKWNPQVLIPIPMYSRKQRKRGYNQSVILARRLGELMNIPVCEDALKKVMDTREQKELSHRQRRSNLKNAFSLEKDCPIWKSVMLVDDVYTTGSTIDAAAGVLREHGVRDIYFVTICIGEGIA